MLEQRSGNVSASAGMLLAVLCGKFNIGDLVVLRADPLPKRVFVVAEKQIVISDVGEVSIAATFRIVKRYEFSASTDFNVREFEIDPYRPQEVANVTSTNLGSA